MYILLTGESPTQKLRGNLHSRLTSESVTTRWGRLEHLQVMTGTLWRRGTMEYLDRGLPTDSNYQARLEGEIRARFG
jgi:hypothetical protein